MSAVPDIPAEDPDSLETKEWLDALEAVMEREGPERAHYLLEKLIEKARRSGAYLPYKAQTAYINTIPPHMEERSPGDAALEDRIRAYCWAATSPALPPWARCSASGRTISGMRPAPNTAAT